MRLRSGSGQGVSCVRGFVIFVGLLLMLGGAAVAGVQYAPVDLAAYPQLDNVPGSREFLTSQMALYAGGGAAAFGFLLIVIAAATGGGKREREVVKPPSMARESIRPPVPRPQPTPAKSLDDSIFAPAPPLASATPKPPPRVDPPPRPASVMPPPAPPKPAAPPAPAAAPLSAPRPAPAPPSAATPQPPLAKPQASAQPPGPAPALAPDPRMVNRKRVQDLVTINDALKAYHARHGGYPKAEGLAGANERGAGWIPGLSPDFLPDMPRDPMHSPATQYVYVSDGANYKLLAQGVSLVGSSNVEVLGIKIDATRNPTAQNAAFGFWTPAFSGV
jgi:outer membrane biosynthesis protein TonB